MPTSTRAARRGSDPPRRMTSLSRVTSAPGYGPCSRRANRQTTPDARREETAGHSDGCAGVVAVGSRTARVASVDAAGPAHAPRSDGTHTDAFPSLPGRCVARGRAPSAPATSQQCRLLPPAATRASRTRRSTPFFSSRSTGRGRPAARPRCRTSPASLTKPRCTPLPGGRHPHASAGCIMHSRVHDRAARRQGRSQPVEEANHTIS